MYKEKLLAYYEANPRETILTLIGIGLGIILLITGVVFAIKESRSQPDQPTAQVLPPPETIVAAGQAQAQSSEGIIAEVVNESTGETTYYKTIEGGESVKCSPIGSFDDPNFDCTIIDQPAIQSNEEVTEPTPAVVEPPVVVPAVTPAVVAKPAVKLPVKPKSFGMSATLNNYDNENGHKVCTQSEKDEHPGVSGKDKGIHVDEDCCIDPDEIPNLNCYYKPSSNKKITKAMDQAKANIGKKLGSKYHK